MKDSYPLYPITGDKQTKPRGGLTGMATGGSFLESLVETIPIAAPVVNALGFRKQVYDPAELPMDLDRYGQTDIKLMKDPLRSVPRSTRPSDLPTSIKAYRADPTGKFGGKEGLETQPIQRTYSGGDRNMPRNPDPATSDAYTDSAKALQELYRHARLLGAAQKHGYPSFTPEEAAAFMLKEGRTDLGHSSVWFGSKREKEFDDMLKKTHNLHPEDQNFLAAINAKKLVADRLGISLAEAWNGTGRNEAGQTGKDYARNWEEQRKAALHPKNKELFDLINRAINEGKQHGLPLRANREKDEIMQRREVPYADGGSVGGWHDITGSNISHKATGGSQEFPLRVPADNDELVPHPKYSWLDKASQGVQAAHDFVSAPFGYENPPGEMVSKLLGVPAVAKTMENLAYGTPVTSGSGMTSNLRPETAEAALGVAPLVGPAVKTAKKVAKAAAPTVAEMATELVSKYGVDPRMNIIKPKGGNWVQGSGSPEDSLHRLYRDPIMIDEAETLNNFIQKKLGNYVKNEMGTEGDPIRKQADAWYEKKSDLLAQKQKQIDKATADMEAARAQRGYTPEMMTKSQARIRDLETEKRIIENQIGLHFRAVNDPTKGAASRSFVNYYEGSPSLPTETVATSPMGTAWENAADSSISGAPYRMHTRMTDASGIEAALRDVGGEYAVKNPNALAYKRNTGITDRTLGFDHLVDELKNALNVESGLPEHLLLQPKTLDKMSVAQASEHVDKINAWRAAQKHEADAARAANKATVVQKEYPENGMKWVELRIPEMIEGFKAPERYEIKKPVPHSETFAIWDREKNGYITSGLKSEEAALKHLHQMTYEDALKDALKYEGEQLNHCVAGYCPDVLSGRTRIFSLRDKDGKPHATIEVKKPSIELTKEEIDQVNNAAMKEANGLYKTIEDNDKWRSFYHSRADELYNQLIAQKEKTTPESIKQIKGESNAAPKKELQPFVQDFVKSGNWSEVKDLKNTGLFKVIEGQKLPGFSKEITPGYYTIDEFKKMAADNEMPQEILESWINKLESQQKYGYAKGGIVRKAIGGITQGNNMQTPTLAQMRMQLNQRRNPDYIDTIGIEQAVDMDPKRYISPNPTQNNFMPVGGVADSNGLPVGGIDQDNAQQGQQFMLQQPQQQPDQDMQPNPSPQGTPPSEQEGTPQQKMGNMLSLTPQGQAMQAMGPAPGQPPRMAAGGKVNTLAKIRAEMKYAKGGSHYPPAPALKKKEIEEMAERMARQTTGLENANEVSQQQTEREKNLSVGITSKKKKHVPIINFEEYKGASTVGVPGDPSRGGVVPSKRKLSNQKAGEYLHSIGGEKLERPVPMYGGKDYGAYGHDDAWASDLGASAGLFNVVKRLAEENPGTDILGHYHKMTPKSLNHAVHMLDAVLSHHKPHKLDPDQISVLNHLMRDVATTKGKHDIPYPEFPGFENPAAVMMHGAYNSGMRKKLIGLLGTEKYFPGGKQKMHDIMFALSHPELRNVETGAGGSSILQFDPTRELKDSLSPHPTYDYDIPSKLIGRTRYTTPAKIIAPRSMHNAEREIKAMGKKVVPFNQAKLNIIREPIDEQYINQLGEYEQAMRKRLGYKKGGKVSEKTQKDIMKFNVLSKKAK